jgi:transposase
MTIKELTELQKRGVDADFRRRVVSAYELGFIAVEQVVNDLKISRSMLRRWCRWYYLQRVGQTSLTKTRNKMAKSKHTLELEQRIAELEKALLAARLGQESLEMMLAHVEKKYDLSKGDIKKNVVSHC